VRPELSYTRFIDAGFKFGGKYRAVRKRPVVLFH